jgi:hypothetical protein
MFYIKESCPAEILVTPFLRKTTGIRKMIAKDPVLKK